MRIPEDIIFRPISKSRQQLPEERIAEPVDSLTASKDALSRPKSGQGHSTDERSYPEKGLPNRQEPQEESSAGFSEERRQGERRKRQIPVLLDTRVNSSRRGSDQYPSINTKA